VKQSRTRTDKPGLHDDVVHSPREIDQLRKGDVKASAPAPSRRQTEHETQKTLIGEDLKDAELRLKAAKAELDRLDELRSTTRAAYSSSEMAKAQLAVRCAEIRVEKLRAMFTDLRH